MALVRRQKPSPGVNGSIGPAEVCRLATEFPTVWEFLSLCKWPDGKSRSTGTILLLTEGGLWKAAVHDRDGGLSTFVSGKTLTGLLEALEKALVAEDTEWREKKAYVPSRGSGRS